MEEGRFGCIYCGCFYYGRIHDFCCDHPHCKNKAQRCETCDLQFVRVDSERRCSICETAVLPRIIYELYDKTPERVQIAVYLPTVLTEVVLGYVRPEERNSGIDLVRLREIAPDFLEKCQLLTTGNNPRRHWIRFGGFERKYELLLDPIPKMPTVFELLRNSAFAHKIKAIDVIAWIDNGGVELSQRKVTFRLIC